MAVVSSRCQVPYDRMTALIISTTRPVDWRRGPAVRIPYRLLLSRDPRLRANKAKTPARSL